MFVLSTWEAKNHQCLKCKKSFYQKGHLNVHIPTIHEGNKDYKCDSCGKSFSEAGHLKKHIHTVHEGQKDHSCESCGKSFSQAIYLKHIHTVHEGHKDHKCEFSTYPHSSWRQQRLQMWIGYCSDNFNIYM